MRLFAVFALALLITGCAPKAIYFAESTKLSIFSAQTQPEPNQPINLQIGYKRRIVAVVPPRRPSSTTNGENEGEALAMLSTFDVTQEAPFKKLTVENVFVTGQAAKKMTGTTQGQRALRQIFAKATFSRASDEVEALKKRLRPRINPMKAAQAKDVLDALGWQFKPGPGCQKSAEGPERCFLREEITRAMSKEVLDKVDLAIRRVMNP